MATKSTDIRAQWAAEDKAEMVARQSALANLLGSLDYALDSPGTTRSSLSDAGRLAHIRRHRDEYDRAIRDICATPRG